MKEVLLCIYKSLNFEAECIMYYSTRHKKLDKKVSPSHESLKNCGTDISRSTNLLHKICETFWALLMLLGSRGIGILDPQFMMLHARHFSRVLPRVTLARHCPFSHVVYCNIYIVPHSKSCEWILVYIYYKFCSMTTYFSLASRTDLMFEKSVWWSVVRIWLFSNGESLKWEMTRFKLLR